MMKQLANEAGYQVNFDQVEKREWNYACKRALSDQTRFHGSDQITMPKDIQLLKDVMNKIVHSLQIKQDNVIDEKETLKKTALDLAPNAQVHKASPGRYEGV
jgi:fido (protein-threonine AMPylation protein)